MSGVQNDTFEAVYFREYGIHKVEDVHIFSFSNWQDLEYAFTHDLPEAGTVLTTELATFPNPQEPVPPGHDVIEERIELVKELSQDTDATILLGSAKYFAGEGIYNTVLHINRGISTAIDRKASLSMSESFIDIVKKASEQERVVRLGALVVICSEIMVSHNMFSQMGEDFSTIFVPCCWSDVYSDPKTDEYRKRWYREAGGPDNYFRNALEESVRDNFEAFPLLDRIVVADRVPAGSPADGPFNAVFDRRR